MNCNAKERCGFYQWMTRERGLNAGAPCPIDIEDCQRIDPAIAQIDVSLVGPATHREMSIAFPKGQILFSNMGQSAQTHT